MAIFSKTKTKSEGAKPEVKKDASVSMQDLYSGASAKKVASGTTAVKKTGVKNHETAYRVLIKPLITEKATNLSAENKYVFMVARSANKISVARAMEITYGVKPVAVNIINSDGKFVTRGRIKGQRSDSKKAIITLKAGDTIKVYEGV